MRGRTPIVRQKWRHQTRYDQINAERQPQAPVPRSGFVPGGAESACGWCRDRWGFSWQVTPRRLLDLTTSSDREAAKRAFEAMMTMRKIDIAALDAAVDAT
jgi:predicted 3-demethylubiquinone-9 3-methyltransferase (glyoxalase superfamily)